MAQLGGGPKVHRKCAYSKCAKPEESWYFYLIEEGKSTGGQDWSPLVGSILCHSCYSRFKTRGTLERAVQRRTPAPVRRCSYHGCDRPDHGKGFYLIEAGKQPGERDWSALYGKVLCESCYLRFRDRGTLERSYNLPLDTGKRRCTNEACDAPTKGNKFLLVEEGKAAGGQDWAPLAGHVLCNACYCRFNRTGSLEKKRSGNYHGNKPRKPAGTDPAPQGQPPPGGPPAKPSERGPPRAPAPAGASPPPPAGASLPSAGGHVRDLATLAQMAGGLEDAGRGGAVAAGPAPSAAASRASRGGSRAAPDVASPPPAAARPPAAVPPDVPPAAKPLSAAARDLQGFTKPTPAPKAPPSGDKPPPATSKVHRVAAKPPAAATKFPPAAAKPAPPSLKAPPAAAQPPSPSPKAPKAAPKAPAAAATSPPSEKKPPLTDAAPSAPPSQPRAAVPTAVESAMAGVSGVVQAAASLLAVAAGVGGKRPAPPTAAEGDGKKQRTRL